MTEFKIIGITRKKGTYQDKPYDNMVIYAISYDKDTIGDKGDKFKVKWRDLAEVFDIPEKSFTLQDFSQLIGKLCYMYFDRYGTVNGVKVIKPDKPETKDSKPA